MSLDRRGNVRSNFYVSCKKREQSRKRQSVKERQKEAIDLEIQGKQSQRRQLVIGKESGSWRFRNPRWQHSRTELQKKKARKEERGNHRRICKKKEDQKESVGLLNVMQID